MSVPAFVCDSFCAVVGDGYTGYWFLVARRIEAGFVDWAVSQRAEKIDLSWQRMHVSGYPVVFRVDLGSAALRDGAITPSPELQQIALLAAAGEGVGAGVATNRGS
jgi:hypothetical protein